MMVYPRSSLYMPYGAYELKARYQTNLMTAMLITITMIGLALSAAWISSLLAGEEIVLPEKDPIVVDPWDIPPPPIIIPETPVIDVAPPEAAMPEYFIPTPRPDDEVIDENIVLATVDERAEIVSRMTSPIAGSGENLVIDTSAYTEYVPPPPDSFVPMEIRPQMISRFVPEYPRLLQQAGITGKVHVNVLIDEEGSVIEAQISRSSGTPGLDEAAIAAAYKNKFSPGIQNGRPIKCWVSYSVVFKLE